MNFAFHWNWLCHVTESARTNPLFDYSIFKKTAHFVIILFYWIQSNHFVVDIEQPFRRHISFTSGSVLKQFANVFVVWVLTDYGHARHSFRLIRFDLPLPLPLHVLTFAKKDICCPCSNKNDGWKWKLIISLILVTMAMQKWYILATTWMSTIHRTPKFQHTHAIAFPNSKTSRKCYVDG